MVHSTYLSVIYFGNDFHYIWQTKKIVFFKCQKCVSFAKSTNWRKITENTMVCSKGTNILSSIYKWDECRNI